MSSSTVARLQDVSPVSGQSIFGIQLGSDTSNNFALTIAGLAVRAPDGRLYAFDRTPGATQPLQDVTGLDLSFGSNFVYRIPVTSVQRGAVIVTGDNPFSVLFVTEGGTTTIRGIDPFEQERVEHVVPRNLFNLNLFVQVFSILDLFGGAGGVPQLGPGQPGQPGPGQPGAVSPLALLLLTQQGGGSGGSQDLTSLLLYSQLFGGGLQGGLGGLNTANPFLLWYLLLGNNSGGSTDLSTLLLASALGGGLGSFAGGFGGQQQLTITPPTANLTAGQTQEFTSSIARVNWSIVPQTGSIRSTGHTTSEYRAPDPIPHAQVVVVVAASHDGTRIGVAQVNLQP